MNPKFKARMAEIIIGTALLILAAALVALGIVAFLFVNTRIPVKVGTTIGWICFAVSIGYMVKRIFLKNWRPDRRIRMAIRSYRAYQRQEQIKVFSRTNSPYYETAFGEERVTVKTEKL